MVRITLSFLFLAWALGFLWFSVELPKPAQRLETDAVIVATGGAGRIERGLDVLEEGLAPRMLVTGVDPEVRPGFLAEDTRGNADETAEWVERNAINSLRLVTTDWHMRRAAGELHRQLPEDVRVVRDAVQSSPSLPTLFLEYHKLIASRIAGWLNL